MTIKLICAVVTVYHCSSLPAGMTECFAEVTGASTVHPQSVRFMDNPALSPAHLQPLTRTTTDSASGSGGTLNSHYSSADDAVYQFLTCAKNQQGEPAWILLKVILLGSNAHQALKIGQVNI